MTCREFADFLLSYVDDELPPGTRAAFDAHLAGCPDCVRFLREYRETIAAAPAAFTGDAFLEAPVDLVRAVLASRRR